jgi:methylmalonyl-CoA mutase cobalamin-binding subunit
VTAKFAAMGFDRVFMPSDDLEEAARLLETDVAARRRRIAGPTRTRADTGRA